jgi:putative endonuclease
MGATMTKPSTQQVGSAGERLAAEYLISQGYVIRERNWHYGRIGEIDIVAEDGASLVFVEVRTRRGEAGMAEESVNVAKQRRLITLAYAWLDEHGLNPDVADWRIDVLAVQLGGAQPRFSLYQNAIEGSD